MEQLISEINSVANDVHTASTAISTPAPLPNLHPDNDNLSDAEDDDGLLDRGEVEPVISPLGLLLGYKKRLSEIGGGGMSRGEPRRSSGRSTWSSGFTPIAASMQPKTAAGAVARSVSYPDAEGPPPHEASCMASRSPVQVIGGHRHAAVPPAVLPGTPDDAVGGSRVGASDLESKLDRLQNLRAVLFIRVTEAQRLQQSALDAAAEMGSALHEASSCGGSDVGPKVELAEGANEACAGMILSTGVCWKEGEEL